ncbi:hypothetical protein MVEN_02275800 [Mycena venus]|uniref:DUF6534 domain-containing protein n=1 Tax=Mycena venus TaxID=2733690 RepID=A0A8H6X507_9AGAR|nr:hypothetical protein MVEN_02275800 [Mycena venus]
MSSSAQPIAAAANDFPNYAAIVASQLIGSLLNFFFFGTLLIQVYVYRLCFPKDPLSIKFFVYFIFLAVTVCTCFNAADVEFWFGTGFGNITRFTDARYSRFYNPLMGSFIGLLVQFFFSCRIVSIRRAAWPFALLAGLLAMAQCAGGVGTGVTLYMDVAVHDTIRTTLVYIWLTSGAAVNILIAGTMTYLFFVDAEAPMGHDIVKRVVHIIIETNVFTAIVAFLGLLLFVVCPHTTYWVCPTMVLPGIYANTFLVALNNRTIQGIGSDSADASASISFPAGSAFPRASVASTMNSKAPFAHNGTVYSANGLGRVLSVPAMSFARREDAQSVHEKTVQEKRPRNSVERQWREDEDEDSESEYPSDEESEVRV